MSSIIYNKAFEVDLSHNFYVYTDAPVDNEFKVNKQLEIIPTAESIDLMRSGRMRFVRTGQGFVVFYQVYKDSSGNEQPFVKVNDGSQFVFAMRFDKAFVDQFLNVTNLDTTFPTKTYSGGKFFMLNQKIVTGTTAPPQTLALTAKLANSLRPSIFSYTFKPSQAPMGLADVIVTFDDTATDVLKITNI
ncbi:MAG TPA: hypothetical protein VFJ43_01980, partial [Bacteroidia bacterium]|nr:hypothetical protein [Bacteroidia bacterium]